MAGGREISTPPAREPVAKLARTFERFTDRARHVLTLAKDEACLLRHNFIGTEHILLGLVREDGGVAAEALRSFGITYEAAREKVEEAVGIAGSPVDSPPFTPRAKKVLELALREALLLEHNFMGTEHLLLGIVREGDGLAAAVLRSLGAEPLALRQELMGLMRGGEQVTATQGQPLRLAPCCPRCRAGIEQAARFRTISVDGDQEEGAREPLTIDVVYCMQCGTTLHMFRTETPR